MSDVVTVTDAALVEAMRVFAERMRIAVEPTGCLAAAAAFAGAVDARVRRVVVVLRVSADTTASLSRGLPSWTGRWIEALVSVGARSGGNVDMARLAALLGGGARRAMVKRVLFLCSRNRLRSPTAERVFADWPGIETASAGLAPDAEEPLTAETLDGVDLVVVMERVHRSRLQRRFGAHLRQARVVCLDIPDDYGFMDPALVALLMARVRPHLDRLTGSAQRRRGPR